MNKFGIVLTILAVFVLLVRIVTVLKENSDLAWKVLEISFWIIIAFLFIFYLQM